MKSKSLLVEAIMCLMTLMRMNSWVVSLVRSVVISELHALEADMGFETEADGVPSYLQPDKESDLDSELNLPSAPTGHGPVPVGTTNVQAEDELGLPAVPRASLRG